MRRPTLASVLVVVLTAAALVVLAVRAGGADVDRCDRFAADSRARATLDSGSGDRVVVIGDSWSAGLGLARTASSWPVRLPGAVHVDGFSGSGFSPDAGSCRGVSFADRAPAAVSGGADLVVVEGGLNDVGVPDVEVRAGFARLMTALQGYDVVVVGPAIAPARAAGVPHVDALLAELAAAYRVPYVRTSGLDLPYLSDRLHLTAAGHVELGDYVAERISELG